MARLELGDDPGLQRLHRAGVSDHHDDLPRLVVLGDNDPAGGAAPRPGGQRGRHGAGLQRRLALHDDAAGHHLRRGCRRGKLSGRQPAPARAARPVHGHGAQYRADDHLLRAHLRAPAPHRAHLHRRRGGARRAGRRRPLHQRHPLGGRIPVHLHRPAARLRPAGHRGGRQRGRAVVLLCAAGGDAWLWLQACAARLLVRPAGGLLLRGGHPLCDGDGADRHGQGGAAGAAAHAGARRHRRGHGSGERQPGGGAAAGVMARPSGGWRTLLRNPRVRPQTLDPMWPAEHRKNIEKTPGKHRGLREAGAPFVSKIGKPSRGLTR
mmetsp:Transcript_44130/g.112633  ORF Transcript_44130/g.112633 Transcript_44130/m.112633 type:complete len:322 (-) Transcript_44130:82-1047(-)